MRGNKMWSLKIGKSHGGTHLASCGCSSVEIKIWMSYQVSSPGMTVHI